MGGWGRYKDWGEWMGGEGGLMQQGKKGQVHPCLCCTATPCGALCMCGQGSGCCQTPAVQVVAGLTTLTLGTSHIVSPHHCVTVAIHA